MTRLLGIFATLVITLLPFQGFSADKTYTNDKLGYSIEYPSNWVYRQANPRTIVFFDTANNAKAFATLNIQALAGKAIGGYYDNATAALDDFKSQIQKFDPKSQLLAAQQIQLNGFDNQEVKAESFVIEYTHNGEPITQAQFLISLYEGRLLYAFGYTATSSVYQKHLPTVMKMLQSWRPIRLNLPAAQAAQQ